MSFFVCGDAKVKSDVLEIKDFASSIFKGLSYDSYEVSYTLCFKFFKFISNLVIFLVIYFVDEVLKKVYNHIIIDNNINRKIKLSFFNNTWLFNQVKVIKF